MNQKILKPNQSVKFHKYNKCSTNIQLELTQKQSISTLVKNQLLHQFTQRHQLLRCNLNL